MEQTSVNQRLNLLVETFEKGKKAAFARKAGISAQGAQEILAGRKGDPSFKVLVKILESYPQIDANWLVLGRGSMLKDASHSAASDGEVQFTPSEEQWTQIMELTVQQLLKSEEIKKNVVSATAAAKAEDDALQTIYYALGGPHTAFPDMISLAARLGISDEEAVRLVKDGKISAKNYGKEGYRITEQAVRDFLGGKPAA